MRILQVLLIAFVLNFYSASYAQELLPENKPGTIKNADFTGFLKTATQLSALPKAHRQSSQNVLSVLHQTIMQTVEKNPVAGFDIRLYGYVYPKTDIKPLISERLYLQMFPFYKYGQELKAAGESQASMELIVNDLDPVLFYLDYYYEITNQLNKPQFFSSSRIIDSNEYYIDIRTQRNQIFRILPLHETPVFIPFTVGEYLDFVSAFEQYRAQEATSSVNLYDKMILESKEKIEKKQSAESSKIAANTLKIAEEKKNEWQNKVKEYQAKIDYVVQIRNSFTTQQLNGPAYLKKGNEYIDKLATNKSGGAELLYKLNPGYFLKNTAPSVPQIAIVKRYESQRCPDYVKRALNRILEEMDYAQLKKALKSNL